MKTKSIWSFPTHRNHTDTIGGIVTIQDSPLSGSSAVPWSSGMGLGMLKDLRTMNNKISVASLTRETCDEEKHHVTHIRVALSGWYCTGVEDWDQEFDLFCPCQQTTVATRNKMHYTHYFRRKWIFLWTPYLACWMHISFHIRIKRGILTTRRKHKQSLLSYIMS